MEIKTAWQDLAKDLGFEFKTGISAFTESPQLLQIMRSQSVMPKDLSMLNNPLFKGIFEKLFLGVVTGVYRDREFFLLRQGTNSSSNSGTPRYYTTIAAPFRKNLELGLKIYKSGLFTTFGRMFFSQKYITLPDKELNQRIAVRAVKRAQVKSFLNSPELLAALKKLYSVAPDIKVDDEGVRVYLPGEIISKDQALAVMEPMAEIAIRMAS